MENADCPLHMQGWKRTVIPSMLYHWPVGFARRVHWRVTNHRRLERERRAAEEEARRIAEEERKIQEEKDRIEAEREAKRAKNAAFLAERTKQEEEKKRRWFEEAAREAEEEQKAAAAKEGQTITGKVVSVDELRKKGHFLIEVAYGEDDQERVQIVADRPVTEGQQAKVALDGAQLPDGKVAKRSKIAGEWSEGVLLSLGSAPAAAAPAPVVEEVAAAEPDTEEAGGGGDGKARQRKKKKG
mmetsp:Transcript_74792/g.209916  ORF Transcript_74792/g.209916 Transcript_74792/m.209916 type:complete len:242 (+) Transcript_74792:2-727(+)